MDITYNLIKPLIVDVEVQGQRVFVEFQQPDSGNFVEAQGPIRQSNSVGSAIGRSVKRTAMQQARSSITRMVGSLFGGGFLGRTARAATSTAASEFTRNQSSNSNAPSESEIQDAVVAAFKTVRTQFHYDEGTGTGANPKQRPQLAKRMHSRPKSTKIRLWTVTTARCLHVSSPTLQAQTA